MPNISNAFRAAGVSRLPTRTGSNGGAGNLTGVVTGAANVGAPSANQAYLRLGAGAAMILVGVNKGGTWHVLTAGGVLLILWQGAQMFGAGGGLMTGEPAPVAPPVGSSPSFVDRARSTVNGLNEAGCQAAANRVGLGTAAGGCSSYLKYLTPLGQAQVAYDTAKGAAKYIVPGGKAAVSAGKSIYNNTLGRLF